MRSTAVLLLTLGAIFVLASGCRPTYPDCKDDSHCSDRGEVCVDEVCQECGTDADCKDGYACEAGACVELPECSASRPCPEGQECQSGSCVEAAQRCTDDEECGESESCQSGLCKPGVRSATKDKNAHLASCTLSRIHFGFDDYALDESSREILEKNAECISYREVPVTIEGHCDERGTDEYNLVLGEKRANSVKRYLVGLGVPANLLRTVSYGEERPLDSSSNEAAWARNRRAEFVTR